MYGGRTSRDVSWSGARVLVLSPTPTHPQDYGNRKRIHAICANLKRRGARVVFLHYPAEQEWRSHIPADAERAMARAWDAYYTIPVTHDLHPSPSENHHQIDEWWDDAIGDFLRWLFSLETFDVFIVNYTWLSKAFEFAPPRVVRILDTNDRFSGRKELLLENGITPEFFYTTDDEEAKGLIRADLVWAIKDEERTHFERIAGTPVVTLLHIDEVEPLPPPATDPEGYLRVGIIAAQNNVNVRNLAAFLETAIAHFEHHFAPIRIVVGGSISRSLSTTDKRFVEIVGELEDVRDFYGGIDVACVPTSFSTGLKIKVAEAISFERPLVALAHAFEGFPPKHAFHVLNDHREMADCLTEIAFDRSMLEQLAGASRQALDAIRNTIEAAMEQSWRIVQAKRRTILYCVDAVAVSETGCMRTVLDSATEYLSRLSCIAVAVVDGDPGGLPTNVPRLEGGAPLVVAEEIVPDEVTRALLIERRYDVCAFADIVARFRPDFLLADAAGPCMQAGNLAESTIIYRASVIAHSHQLPRVVEAANTAARKNFVCGRSRSYDLERLGKATASDVVSFPSFYASPALRKRSCEGRPAGEGLVAILDGGRWPGIEPMIEMLTQAGWNALRIVVEPHSRGIAPQVFVERLWDESAPLPVFAVDVSFGALPLQFAREVLDWLGVRTITAECLLVQPSVTGADTPWRPRTAGELVTAIEQACSKDNRKFVFPEPWEPAETFGRDAGWAWLWRLVSKSREEAKVGVLASAQHPAGRPDDRLGGWISLQTHYSPDLSERGSSTGDRAING